MIQTQGEEDVFFEYRATLAHLARGHVEHSNDFCICGDEADTFGMFLARLVCLAAKHVSCSAWLLVTLNKGCFGYSCTRISTSWPIDIVSGYSQHLQEVNVSGHRHRTT